MATGPQSGDPVGSLAGVDAGSASDAWAVGSVITDRQAGRAIALPVDALSFHWNGERWREVPTVDASATFELLGSVGIEGRDRDWAVGYAYHERRARDETLVVRWNGDRWRRVASGNRTDGNQLVDIVVRPPLYLAVGGFWANDGEGPQRTLVVRRCPS